jgi:hypothetical protein
MRNFWMIVTIFFLEYPYLVILFTSRLMNPSLDTAHELILTLSISWCCSLCSFVAALLSTKTP